MIFKNLQYNVINRLSAHLKNAKKLKAYHDWFIKKIKKINLSKKTVESEL